MIFPPKKIQPGVDPRKGPADPPHRNQPITTGTRSVAPKPKMPAPKRPMGKFGRNVVAEFKRQIMPKPAVNGGGKGC
jgi:hypothetical protein